MVKQLKKATFTMIEVLFVIVILALISVGSFKAIQMLYERYYQANTITKFSINSQILLNQLSTILYYRVSLSAIGYDPSDNTFKQLSDITDNKYTIFEWISEAHDAKNHISQNIHKGYSGFIDLDGSDKNTKTLLAKDFNITDTNNTLHNIFDNNNDLNQSVAIIFAGTFDNGDSSANQDYNNSFGWHGHKHTKVFLIKNFTQNKNDANITLYANEIDGNRIFAKYYLADSAWGISRGENIDKTAKCLQSLNINNNTLLIFYDYRPWLGETFCADTNYNSTNNKRSGKVAILSNNVSAFKIKATSNHIEIKVQFSKPLYRGSEQNIIISIQKVVF